MNHDTCPICKEQVEGGQSKIAGQRIYEVRCLRCGTLRVDKDDWEISLSQDQRLAVAWYVRKRNRADDVPLLDLAPGDEPLKGSVAVIDIEAVVPRNIDSIHDEILLYVGEASSFGQEVTFGPQDSPVALVKDLQGVRFHAKELDRAGLVEQHATSGHQGQVTLKLTAEGWKRVEDLRRGRVDKPRQAFVAMWFNEEEMGSLFDDAFKPAIRQAGFDAIQMAFVEHNDDINDRIIAEIRKSRLMVADFTGGRGGVYFEAGFAMGLAKPVIWTCREDWKDRIHFDTEHRNHIFWKGPADLRRRLRARIEATVPART